MRKHFMIILATTLLGSNNTLVLADNLDENTIKQIHEQVKTSFFIKCKQDIEGATEDLCHCLADKAQASLNNDALSTCANDDSGNNCISAAIANAFTKATNKDSIILCAHKGVVHEASPLVPDTNTSTHTNTPTNTTEEPINTPDQISVN